MHFTQNTINLFKRNEWTIILIKIKSKPLSNQTLKMIKDFDVLKALVLKFPQVSSILSYGFVEDNWD